MNTRLLFSAASLIALSALLGGCRGDREDAPPRQFFPDLDDQLKWKPQSKSEFFSDGRTMRKPVPGAVAFGTVGFDPTQEWAGDFAAERSDLLKADARFYEGVAADGTYLDAIPVPVTLEMVQHGQQKFDTYCSVCHGYLGDGQGQVGKQWAVPVANLLDPKYQNPDPRDPASQLHKDGYLFHTARYGLPGEGGQPPRMPGYAHALTESDAWAVVAYVRALQASRQGTIEDVPESAREELRKQRGAVTTPAATTTGGSK